MEATDHPLYSYLPSSSLASINKWLDPHRVTIRVSKPRTSKLGDFKFDKRKNKATISVNGNLNEYSFLITLTHEIAHLKDFEIRQTFREAHGPSWKTIYAALLQELQEQEVFPENLKAAVHAHIHRPTAASCSDRFLLEALRVYDSEPTMTLNELPEGAQFMLTNGRSFIKGSLRRTRYTCQEIGSERRFLVHGLSEVTPIGDQ